MSQRQVSLGGAPVVRLPRSSAGQEGQEASVLEDL